MTCRARSRIAGNVLTAPKSLPRALLPSRARRRTMNSPNTNQLWNRSTGIRFSPKREQSPLYPSLELSRFLYVSGARSHDEATLEPPRVSAAGSHEDASLEFPIEEFENSLVEPVDFFDCSDELNPPAVPSPAVETEPGTQLETGSVAKREEDGERVLEKIDPPMTSLDYKISADLFHAARASPAGSPASFWSHTMYQRVAEDGSVHNVKVHYCTSRHSMEKVLQTHFMDAEVIGLDLEWLAWATRSDDARRNVSLIQLATPSRIGLFHVALFADDGDLVGPTFRKIMYDSNVSKVGVSISGDCTRLKKYLDAPVRGIFELSHLYKLVKHSNDGRLHLINRVSVSLSIQTEAVLGLPLYKGAVVRTGDWMKPLNEQQLTYSAADAYSGLQLFYVLEGQREKLKPCPPRPHHAESGLPIRVAEDVPNEDSDAISDDSAFSSETEEILNQMVVEVEAQASPSTPKPRLQTSRRLNPKPVTVRDARILAAEQKMVQYRTSKQTSICAAPSALRAYYIWHGNDDLNAESVAKILRDPPLQTSTVVTYILDAVTAEKLPYNKPKMSEVLSLLHPTVLENRSRYQVLAKDCQAAEQAP